MPAKKRSNKVHTLEFADTGKTIDAVEKSEKKRGNPNIQPRQPKSDIAPRIRNAFWNSLIQAAQEKFPSLDLKDDDAIDEAIGAVFLDWMKECTGDKRVRYLEALSRFMPKQQQVTHEGLPESGNKFTLELVNYDSPEENQKLEFQQKNDRLKEIIKKHSHSKNENSNARKQEPEHEADT